MSDSPPAPSSPERLYGWGRGERASAPGRELRAEDLPALAAALPLTRGLGRAYGDAALPAPGAAAVAGSTLADRILAWDPETGVLRAEAGLSLREMNRLLLPRGWFTPVTPGTHFVTLGGMVAADVHGKAHHSAGTFGEHVRALRLQVADGRELELGPSAQEAELQELFFATVGGMGLTGHILEVEVQLRRVPSPWILQESERIPDLETFLRRMHETSGLWPMSVGWMDCLADGEALGRGTLMVGRWASWEEAYAAGKSAAPRPKRRLPAFLPLLVPSFLLNRWTGRLGNEVLFRKHPARTLRSIVHPETYFYPLDQVRGWNRMYGRRGLTQYQAILPTEAGPEAPRRFLLEMRRAGGHPLLCVIKDCGPEGRGLLSWPRPGISLALDFKVDAGTPALVRRLNALVIEMGGRVYLAKDAFSTAEELRAMDGERIDRFLAVRRRWDPRLRLRSALSTRLLGDPPREGGAEDA